MDTGSLRYVYGPVPSRRLGRSLGVDLVPFKICTYDCVYCQLGRTTCKTIERKPHSPVDSVLAEIEWQLAHSKPPAYITLAGSGEPTLNENIGELIKKIKAMSDIPVVVLTNGSLLWREDVRSALMPADIVAPSLDAGNPELFEKINRPHSQIPFDRMCNGLIEFSKAFSGEVWLEVMLLAGSSGLPAAVEQIASVAEKMAPARIQVNTVCRPPAESSARPLSPEQLANVQSVFPGQVEVIYEPRPMSEENKDDIIVKEGIVYGLIGRRPCTPMDVAQGLGIHINEAIKHLEIMASSGKARTIQKDGNTYYAAAKPSI